MAVDGYGCYATPGKQEIEADARSVANPIGGYAPTSGNGHAGQVDKIQEPSLLERSALLRCRCTGLNGAEPVAFGPLPSFGTVCRSLKENVIWATQAHTSSITCPAFPGTRVGETPTPSRDGGNCTACRAPARVSRSWPDPLLPSRPCAPSYRHPSATPGPHAVPALST